MRKQSQSLISFQKLNSELANILLNAHESGKYTKMQGDLGIPHTNRRCAQGVILSERYGYDPATIDKEGLSNMIEQMTNDFGVHNIALLETLNDETDKSFKEIAYLVDHYYDQVLSDSELKSLIGQ